MGCPSPTTYKEASTPDGRRVAEELIRQSVAREPADQLDLDRLIETAGDDAIRIRADFAHTPPSREAIEVIEQAMRMHGRKRILEVGAGSGFWTLTLQARGHDIDATDRRGTKTDRSDKFMPRRYWTEVRKARAKDAIENARDALILSVCPTNDFGYEIIDSLAAGQVLVLVAFWSDIIGDDANVQGEESFVRALSYQLDRTSGTILGESNRPLSADVYVKRGVPNKVGSVPVPAARP